MFVEYPDLQHTVAVEGSLFLGALKSLRLRAASFLPDKMIALQKNGVSPVFCGNM